VNSLQQRTGIDVIRWLGFECGMGLGWHNGQAAPLKKLNCGKCMQAHESPSSGIRVIFVSAYRKTFFHSRSAAKAATGSSFCTRPVALSTLVIDGSR
jgi:hypothetical protein